MRAPTRVIDVTEQEKRVRGCGRAPGHDWRWSARLMHDELQEQLEGLGRRGHVAVVAGALVGGERIVRGWARTGQAPDQLSLFEIGSITKVFTGILLADMHLRGEVSFDDPLSAHLPGGPTWRHREPTLLELATHRSALPNTPKGMSRRELAYVLGLGRGDPWAEMSDVEYGLLVRGESPRPPPGGRVRYSSMAVGLLGDALARRANKAYDDLLAERVLDPLGMAATAVTVRPAWRPRLLVGHSRRGRPRPPMHDLMSAAGSLRSNADDMLRFLAACLQPPAAPPGPALALAQRPHARIGRRLEVGLCWMISTDRTTTRTLWHNGATWGFRSFAGLVPDQAAAAVVMSSTFRSVDRLGRRLLAEVPHQALSSPPSDDP